MERKQDKDGGNQCQEESAEHRHPVDLARRFGLKGDPVWLGVQSAVEILAPTAEWVGIGNAAQDFQGTPMRRIHRDPEPYPPLAFLGGEVFEQVPRS